MDREKWQLMEDILDKYAIKPLVGIIPANADPETIIDADDSFFWEKAQNWSQKRWTIALHGYNHVCTTETGGLNPVHKRSEFAGLPYKEQCQKIRDGYALLKEKGLDVKWFFAPSHTFDKNTLKAIKESTPIRYISDMIATSPYLYGGFTFVPCQMGVLREMPISGYWCACYHPNIMKDEEFEALESFIKNHKEDFISFEELPEAGSKSVKDKLLSLAYYTLRRIKG
jgi:predicted deacetylase